MILADKILFVGLVISTAAIITGEERHVQSRGEVRRLNGPYIRRRRPAIDGSKAPPYAVPMEPLVKYSQRDPLYKSASNRTIATPEYNSRGDYDAEGTNNVAEYASSSGYGNYGYSHPQYYQEPEPIIEIIIKESNESLPAPTTPPPPPTTKEPIHVFYVKYKKNPNASGKYGESDIIYEPPVPALTQHESDTIETDHKAQPAPQYVTEQPYLPPPPTTTLRTIIRPDSETYHGSSLKITFGSSDHGEKNDHELEYGASEVDSRLPDQNHHKHAESREFTDTTTPKPHYFKRQQGPYFPPSQVPPNLHHLTPPPPANQYQQTTQQGRHSVPSQTTQAIFNRNNPKTNSGLQQAASQFRPQQQPAGFQRNQPYNPNTGGVIQPTQFHTNHNNPNQQFHGGHQQAQTNNRLRVVNEQNLDEVDQSRRPQFQPTLEAQIEEYQKQKLFLYQQNLKHQAQQQAEQANQAQIHSLQNTQNHARNPQQPNQYSLLQPIHVQSPQRLQFQQTHPSSHSQRNEASPQRHRPFTTVQPLREPINLNAGAQKGSAMQNFVSPRPINPLLSLQASQSTEKPFIPSQEHIPQKQTAYNQPSQATFAQANVEPSDFGIEYANQDKNFYRQHKPIHGDAEIVRTISPIEDIQVQSDVSNGQRHVSVSPPSEVSENQHNSNTNPHYENHSDSINAQYNAFAEHNAVTQPDNHKYEQFHSTTPKPRPTFTSRTSTTSAPTTPVKVFSLVPPTNPTPQQQIPQEQNSSESDEESPEQQEKKKANLAALPDEVPDDLREQLLSSGILGNADIQILDYDKVGDIPIESLPPEALENLYGAGSAPVASVVRPDGSPSKKPVEMKVVRYDPSTSEGQGLADRYLKDDATQLDPVVLNDTRYNRYLPLKISGSNFPLPDVPQLKGRIVNSVVVLAPVDYDFIKTKDDVDRHGRTIQVEGVRFIAGDSLKTLVKEPTPENFDRWLQKERDTPTRKQSVVLLVTSPTAVEKSGRGKKMEIFMYDVATSRVSKLRGELSTTFVEVAESNSGSEELEELAASLDEYGQPQPVLQ